MIGQLVVHVGDAKSGSTSIQRSLADGAWSAPGQSICYPTALNHNRLVRTLGKPAQRDGRLSRLKTLREAFSASDAQAGLISSELLEFHDPSTLAQVLENHLPDHAASARILCYVRPHAERFASSVAQRIKQGEDITDMEATYATETVQKELSYLDRLSRWRDVFGHRFEVRAFARAALRNGDVVDDFLGWVLGGTEVKLTGASVNESLCLEDLSFLRTMYRVFDTELGMDRGALAWFAVNFTPLLAAETPGGGTKLRLHRALAERLKSDFIEDARKVDDEFLGGTVMADALASAPDKAIAEPLPLTAESYLDPRALGQIRAMARLLVRMRGENPERFAELIEDPIRKLL